jgi:hypothetical protein
MIDREAQSPPSIGDVEPAAERLSFLRSKTFLGAARRSLRPGITAAMLLEEGCFYAEQKYHWTGVAATGAVLSEGLWAYQIDKERRDRERSLHL